MSAYFHDQCVKEDGIEYTLLNDNICTVLKFPDNITLGKVPVHKPPIVNRFDVPDNTVGNNPFTLIRDIIEDIIGEKHPNSNIIVLYIILTHCFDLFDEIPLLNIYLPQYSINTIIEDIFKKLCFNGIPVQSQLSMNGIIALIDKYTPSLIFNYSDNKLITKYPTLLNSIISKHNTYVDDSLIEKSIFCPRIILSKKMNNHIGNELQVIIRNIKNNPVLNGSQLGNVHLTLINFFLNEQDNINNSYMELYKSNPNVNRIVLPLLTIAQVLLEKDFIDLSEYKAIETDLKHDSLIGKSILNADDEIILCLYDFFKLEKYKWPLSDLVPYDVLCGFINKNSTHNTKLKPRALSQFLNKNRLVIKGKRGTRNVDDHEFQLYGNSQPMCVIINKYKLDKRIKELL